MNRNLIGRRVSITPKSEFNHDKSVKGKIIDIEDEYYRIEFDQPEMIYDMKVLNDLYLRETFNLLKKN